MKGIIMKIRKVISGISIFATVPFLSAGLGPFELAVLIPGTDQCNCYLELSGGRSADTPDDPLLQAIRNFDLYNSWDDDFLVSFVVNRALEGRDLDVAKWILRERGVEIPNGGLTEEEATERAKKDSLESTNTHEVPVVNSYPNRSYEELYEELSKLSYEKLLKLCHEELSKLCHEELLKLSYEELLEKGGRNPEWWDEEYYKKALEAAGQASPEINRKKIEALLEIHLKEILEGKYTKEDLIPYLPSPDSGSSDDEYTMLTEELKSFLTNEGFVPITTPGYGNCAFDATLLSWLHQRGLYEPYWNDVLGKYLEKYVGWFRSQIAKSIQRLKESIPGNNGDEKQQKAMLLQLKEEVSTKNCYVTDAVFPWIAQNLNKKIIIISTISDIITAQCVLPSETAETFTTLQALTPEETSEFIAKYPDALFICNNGKEHFLALRKK